MAAGLPGLLQMRPRRVLLGPKPILSERLLGQAEGVVIDPRSEQGQQGRAGGELRGETEGVDFSRRVDLRLDGCQHDAVAFQLPGR